ncbi:carboxypeptidase-like regulatory domain-containing protein [Anaerolentibacter hominis]|uniref:carboxypeptidase-like regulatory domain-containing protein n=1 Tax=Anaerolentibacter hominis TaxID=3079009 RepID=UPI0031B808CD
MDSEKDNKIPSEKTRSGRPAWLVPLAAVLLILMMITSCMVGFILGRHTRDYRGQILDTIILQPEAETEQTVHFAGQILYPDGTPFAGKTIRLHSKPRETQTDSRGRFLFSDVETGDHTLFVMDGEQVLAENRVTLKRQEDFTGVDWEQSESGDCSIQIAADILYVEIAVQLSDGSDSVQILPERIAGYSDQGSLYAGQKEITPTDGPVILPGGTVLTTDGTLLLPGQGAMDNSGTLTPPEDGYTAGDGTTLEEDGTITFPDGTKELPDLSIENSEGTTTPPVKEPVRIQDKTPVPVETEEGKNPPSKPGTENNDQNDNKGTKPVSPPDKSDQTDDGGDPPNKDKDTGGNKPDDKPDSDKPDDPGKDDETPGTDEPGTDTPGTDTPGVVFPPIINPPDPDEEEETKFDVIDSASGKSWKQVSSIDIFYNRTAGITEKLAPGSEGYYCFELMNPEETDIIYTLEVGEQSFSLPMRYRLADITDGGERYVMGSGWYEAAELKDKTVRIPAGERICYRLDWKWPFSISKEQDEKDSAVGAGSNRSYIVTITVRAKAE